LDVLCPSLLAIPINRFGLKMLLKQDLR